MNEPDLVGYAVDAAFLAVLTEFENAPDRGDPKARFTRRMRALAAFKRRLRDLKAESHFAPSQASPRTAATIAAVPSDVPAWVWNGENFPP